MKTPELRLTTTGIASRLVELCRQRNYLGAQRELYDEGAVSIEPDGAPQPVTRGLEAIAEKTRLFEAKFETHGGTVSDPIVAGDYFACTMTVDVTGRASGSRLTLTEVCVYEVRDGRINREQFFHPIGA